MLVLLKNMCAKNKPSLTLTPEKILQHTKYLHFPDSF